MVSNLNEMARKMSKLSGEIVRNDTADLGGETGRRGGGRLLQRHVPLGEPARDTFAAHPRTWMHSKRGSLAGRSSYWF